jgi:hypothetical protein
MSSCLKPYFDTEGPFGLPMKSKQAKALEARLHSLPKDDAFGLRRCSLDKGITEVLPEARSEVSWITAETPDRAGDLVVARGMDDSHFQLNPIVTLNHAYDRPPVGRSLWRRRVREGTLVGVKAKTIYPARPADWASEPWPPDEAFSLIQAGLLRGKSIGFFPLKLRTPTTEEIERSPMLKGVRYIIEEWLLAEYACCYLPMQPHAVVEEVAKAAAVAADFQSAPLQLALNDNGMSTPQKVGLKFTTLAEIAKSLPARLFRAGLEESLEKALQRTWQKLQGRV